MQIHFIKKDRRSQLVCTRRDGTSTRAELGPSLPHHDLAHYVVEKKLGLTRGFYGSIARGHTIAELSDRDTIRTLGAESWLAEIVARALQSLHSGACRLDQLDELLKAELGRWSIEVPRISREDAEAMLRELQSLLDRYDSLPPGTSFELILELGESGSGRAAGVIPGVAITDTPTPTTCSRLSRTPA